MSKLTLITGDVVYLNFTLLETKYIVDCALSGNAGCREAFKDKAMTQKVIINLKTVVVIEEEIAD